MIDKNINAILFDLGGLFIDIDYQKTVQAFEQLDIKNFDSLYAKAKQSSLFDDLETGKISEEDFYAYFQNATKKPIAKEKLKNAWNSMLLKWNEDNLMLLKKLRAHYSLYLFSNTNSIHQSAFEAMFKKQIGSGSIQKYFDVCYFSHEFGQRKPDCAAFQTILKQNQLIAEQTLFLDDSIQHIEGAKKLGIQTQHVETNASLFNFFF
jgi:putative hydrolase of the HAD superfamily